MQKTKVLTILIIAFFIFQMVSFENNEISNFSDQQNTESVQRMNTSPLKKTNPEVVSEKETISEKTVSEKTVSEVITDKTISPKSSITTQAANTWRQGETVKMDIDPPRSYSDRIKAYNAYQSDYSIFRIPEDGGSITIWNDYSDILVNDGGIYGIIVDDGLSADYSGGWAGYVYIDIPVPISSSDSMSWEVCMETEDSGGSTDSKCFASSSIITQNYVYNGKVSLELYGRADGDWNLDNQFWYQLNIFDYQDGTWDILATGVSDPDNLASSTKFRLGFDYLYFGGNMYTLYTGTFYMYNAPIAVHTVTVDVFASGSKIAVYAPLSWNLTSVNPSASYSYDSISQTWNITGTVPTTYTLTFLSGAGWGVDYKREPYILALEEYDSYSYEGTLSDWTSNATLQYDTGVVFSGVQSLYASSSTRLTLDIADGEYYVSYAYWGTVNGSTSNIRWTTAYQFVSTSSIILDLGAGSYLDSVRIYKANPKIATVGYNTYSLNTTLNYWTAYGLYPASGVDANLELRDRTANTIIRKWNGTTDQNGYFSATYFGQLEEKEYEIRAYSPLSWWGAVDKDYNELLSNYFIGGFSVVESTGFSTSSKIGRYSYFVKGSDGDLDNYVYLGSLSIDIANDDYLVASLKTNVTTTFNQKYILDSAGNYRLYETDYTVNTEWTEIIQDIGSGYFESGTLDMTDISILRFDHDKTTPITIWIDAVRTIQAQKTYWTPQQADQYVYGFDWSESSEKWRTKYGADIMQLANGTIQVTSQGGGGWRGLIMTTTSKLPDFSKYPYVKIRTTTNYTETYSLWIASTTSPNPYLYYSMYAGQWTVIDSPLSGTVEGDEYDMRLESRSWTAPYFQMFDYLRFYFEISPQLYDTGSGFFLSSTNDTLTYAVWSDGVYIGDYYDLELIPYNYSIGAHNLTYVPIYNWDIENVQIPGSAQSYLYTITESDLTSISLVDQRGSYIDPRQYVIKVDGTRIYGDTFLWSDTSQSHTISIEDFWGNVLYSGSESYARFKDYILTLYSVKIYNEQPNPAYLYISNGPVYSEWILPGEIVEYRLSADSYNFTIVYSSDVSGFAAATTNGTTASYIFTVSGDTALVISGESISDVFGNVQSLTNDLSAVNATLSNQIVSVNITVSNINNTISNQIVNVDINLNNVNSTLGNQLASLNLDLSNVNSTLYSQTISILSNIANVNATLYNQTVSILSDLSNVNSTLYLQTVTILSSIQNVNSSLYAQTLDILSQIDLTNSTQVTLILSNYQAILDAQVAAAEYMSQLRIETYVPTLSDSSVSYSVSTNWANSSISVYVNGTIALNVTEGSFVISNLGSGTWNITLVFNSGSSSISRTDIFVITAAPVTYTLVHFRFANELGVGLPFTIALLNVNGSATYSSEKYYLPGTFLNITVYSWTDTLLKSMNYTVGVNETDIVIKIPIFDVEFRNKYEFDILVTLTASNNVSFAFVVPSNSSYLMQAFEGTFNATYEPITPPTIDNGTHLIEYTSLSLKSLEIRKSMKSVTLSVGVIAESIPQELQKGWVEKNLTPILIAIFGTTTMIGISIALFIFGLRAFMSKVISENVIEPTAKKVAEKTPIELVDDYDDAELRMKKKYRNLNEFFGKK